MDYDRAWSSQEWKSEVTAHERSGKLDKTSWNVVQQVRPHHEATLLNGTAQSVRCGELLRDRSGQLDDINSQEAADSTNFIMGSDAAEFVNKVKDQVRKRQKRMSNVADSGEGALNNMVNVYGCEDECSDIHGKEFPRPSKFNYEHNRSHPEANVRHHSKIGERTR